MLNYVTEVIRLLRDIKNELKDINEKLGNRNSVARPVVRTRVRHIVPRVVTRNR